MSEFQFSSCSICGCGSDVGVRDCCGQCVSHCACEDKGAFVRRGDMEQHEEYLAEFGCPGCGSLLGACYSGCPLS